MDFTDLECRQVLDHLDVGVYIVDADRRIRYWNRPAEAMTGHAGSDLLGRQCNVDLRMHMNLAGQSMCDVECPLQATLESGRPVQREVFMNSADGHRVMIKLKAAPLYDSDGRQAGALQIFSDLSMREEFIQRLNRLQSVADADPLTGLRNRRYLELVLERGLKELKTFKLQFGVIFMDVDNLKEVNTRGGHAAGDAALRQIAYVLRRKVRRDDVVARWGGDEFLVFLGGVTPVRLAEIGNGLVAGVAAISRLAGEGSEPVTISAGATMAFEDDTLEGLVQRADSAQYRSKRGGKNRLTMAE
jgi:diguanylate cyclase (GGDEF)-like protein/PAS domain S-box-containing protein